MGAQNRSNQRKELKDYVRGFFSFLVSPIVKTLRPYRTNVFVYNLANAISVSRFVVSIWLGYKLMTAPSYDHRLQFIGIMLLLILSDGIDGAIAEGLDAKTHFGKAFDPFADKVFIGFLVIGLAYCFGQLAFTIAIGVLLLVEVLNTIFGNLVNYLAMKLSKESGAGKWGKYKMVIECLIVLQGWINPDKGTALAISWLLLLIAIPLATLSFKRYFQLYRQYRSSCA